MSAKIPVLFVFSVKFKGYVMSTNQSSKYVSSSILLFILFVLVFPALPDASNPQLAAAAEKQSVEITERLDTIKAVPFTDVHLNDVFWAPRIETNRTVTIPHAFKKCEETNRVENFERSAKVLRGEKLEDNAIRGYSFDDTDLYKTMEGASFGLSVEADAEMDEYLDKLIEKIAAAQEPDGYLFTARTINPERPHEWAGKKRWEKVRDLSHELYNMGHFYEAAVAHYQATGKRSMLDIATRNADLLCKTFGPGKNEYWPGHQIIEMALCKLYRTTGEKKYLDLAKFFLDTRGPDYGTYAQAHKKVNEQSEAVGHAVRAVYMYSGMADVATLTGDKSYIDAIDKIWEDVVGRKLYITGGIGAAGGHEGFADAYELPNMTAYCETCASIANVFWNHRLFMLHGDAKYIDVLERTLYNGLIDGVSLDGKRFFYPNPLASRGQHSRSEWFGCACCPSNVARFVASVPGYLYATKGNELYVNLFAAGSADIKLGDNKVKITQQSRYPWDGNIKMTVEPAAESKFTVKVRIPEWAQNKPLPTDLYHYLNKSSEKPTLKVNGKAVDLNIDKGYVSLERVWKKADTIELSLPLPIRRVIANEKVEADRGKTAIERGPIVFCAEWPDNNRRMLNLMLPDDVKLKTEPNDMLGGILTIRGKAYATKEGEGDEIIKTEQALVLIPYYAWAHRGNGEMMVWLARNEDSAEPVRRPTIASKSRIRISRGQGPSRCIVDGFKPRNSVDGENSYYHWWPKKGTSEWVQLSFNEPTTVSSVELYWYDDTGRGECRVPKSWKLLYKENEEFKEVSNPSGYGAEKDKFNKTSFEPVETGGLRVEIQLQDEWSAGIIELKVNE